LIEAGLLKQVDSKEYNAMKSSHKLLIIAGAISLLLILAAFIIAAVF
jgi:preprotein translocase subunit Sec61beta